TPAAVTLLGLVTGAVCALSVSLKYKFGFDDSLDVVGVHFVGGWIGSLWIGLFGTSAVTSLITAGGPSNGLFYGGGLTQLLNQAKCSGFVTVWSFGIAYALGWVINKTIGFRVTEEAEVEGIDVAEHAES